MNIKALAASAAVLVLSAICAEAKSFGEAFPGRSYAEPKAQQFVESLDYQDGLIPLGAGGVTLNVPNGFYFLSATHSQRVITEAWGNPPATAQGVLGMILPAGKTPLDDAWGAIITYDEDGYVSDEEAASINYTDLLKSMQEGTEQANEERVKQGFPAIRLVGWASPPFYDRATHKLHWAKELEFNDSPQRTLNYDVRALGRKGVLRINFVAGMDQFAEIKGVIPAVMAMPEFAVGSRYQDFVPGVDKVAAYGIGGLIAGKLLSKAGFFALALAFLKKGWILVVFALAGLFSLARRFFQRTPTA
jgi:uncharacterized membrane-anchored protein